MSGLPEHWRRPEGVDEALWSYMSSPDVTVQEHLEERSAPLALLDRRYVERWLRPGDRVLDLGCGTGRITLDLLGLGHEVVAIDLSRSSLARLRERIEPHQRSLVVRADLCRLDALRAGSLDAALLLYSTLGMVRGRSNRRKVLAGAARAVRPDGTLIVHAHNLWAHLHPSVIRPRIARAGRPGRGWLDRFGDQPMRYAGIPDVKIHLYRWAELRTDLATAGWRITEVVPLARGSGSELARPWLGHPWRADGWIMRAERISPPVGDLERNSFADRSSGA